jgi:hypothetical protein
MAEQTSETGSRRVGGMDEDRRARADEAMRTATRDGVLAAIAAGFLVAGVHFAAKRYASGP